MKALNQSRESIVLATILFAVGGVSFVNAAGDYFITGATKNGNIYDGSKGNSGNTVEISEKDTIGSTKFVVNTTGWAHGGYGGDNGENVINNTLKVTNVDYANYPAYRGGYITGGSGSVLNNSIIIDKSYFRGVYGGLISLKQYGATGNANYNTVKITDSMVDSKNNSDANFRAGSIEKGSGDVQYNTLEISGSTIKAPVAQQGTQQVTKQVNISSGLLQNGSGNSRYNQVIISGAKTTITRSIDSDQHNVIFGGRIINPNGTSQEIVGNRAYIQNLEYLNGNIVAGGSANNSNGGSGVTTLKDNIAVISGDTKIKNAYGSWVKGLNNAKLSDNLIIVNLNPDENSAKISGNVYGSLNEAENGGTSENSAVYFMNGVVGGTVGGGKLANTGNTLILGRDTENFGLRQAGTIENFANLQFNTLKKATDTEKNAVLTLTDSQIGADLNGVTINFLNGSTTNGAVEVVVGGNSGTGVNKKRNNGGGANAITNLTANAKKYSPNLDTIAVVKSGANTNNDIYEHDQAPSYGIGDTFNYAYEKIYLTKAGKYYLINSESEILNYKSVDIDDKLNADKTLKDTNIEVITAIQPDQIYKIIDKDTYTRNLRGMFAENKKAIYITGTNKFEETWENDKFDSDEFTKFGKPSESGNEITIAKGAGELNKTIYGGESTDKPVSGNSIIIEEGANLSNATIIGGYSEKGNVLDNNISLNKDATSSGATLIGGFSKSGKVSGNNIDLNNTDIKADIILAQIKEDGAEVKVSNDNIKNADGVTIGGSVTIAKSTGSANLNGLNFEMPKFEKITGDFTLADT
ncbi:hypothetical protein OFN97_07905, partial [Campylobacter sp. VBCF_05 NA6]|uniref:hypothetical protein n=1 Tax=unclassified Campylobacter TaxID=2593542 RepID=UPI0022E9A569